MEEDAITSLRNPLIKRMRTLLRHDARAATIAIEGLRAIIAAIDADLTIETLLWAPERLRSAAAAEAIARAQRSGAMIFTATAAVLDELSTRDGSQGAIALATRPQATLTTLPATRSPLVIALYEPQDPGNVGTIARAADGAGAAALLVLGPHGVDPFHPRAVRASMGSLFALPVIEAADALAAARFAQQRGYRVVGAAGQATATLWDTPLHGATLLLMGNERTGLPEDVLGACDDRAQIPLAGQADSLNVATAAAIFLFEAVRQRRASVLGKPV